MEQEKLNEFNAELTTLLNKYNVGLTIEQKIVVAPIPEKKEEVNSESKVTDVEATEVK